MAAAVISVAGAYELNTLSWGNLWSTVESDLTLASPIRQITSTTKPMLIIHSDDDRSVLVEQAVDMAAALTAAGVRHHFVHYQDRGHMSITDYVITETRAFITELEGRE